MFCIPSLKHNLISVHQLCRDNNYSVIFNESSICVNDKISCRTLLYASSSGNFYLVRVTPAASVPTLDAFVDPAIVWHHRLGHCRARTLSSLRHSHLVSFPNKFHYFYS